MIKVDIKKLEGIWVAPDHPITCSNPAPWQIEYVKIDLEGVVRIRCEGSMWFRLDQCISDTKENLEEYLVDKYKPDCHICLNCKKFWVNPPPSCKCGHSSFEPTHYANKHKAEDKV